MLIIENRIKELLAIHKKDGKDLAIYLGVTPNMISRYCQQENMPKYSQLPKIAEFFGIQPLELLKVVEIN